MKPQGACTAAKTPYCGRVLAQHKVKNRPWTTLDGGLGHRLPVVIRPCSEAAGKTICQDALTA